MCKKVSLNVFLLFHQKQRLILKALYTSALQKLLPSWHTVWFTQGLVLWMIIPSKWHNRVPGF
jgi:hypothetical protein